ncbi:MAG: hypothetical protein WA294_07735 [Acidobacteriaceae bacterium]
MPLLLLLEDSPADIRKAADIGRHAGFTEVEVYRFSTDGKIYLEKGLRGEVPLPQAIVIDIDLGIESGFELLRFWHRIPQLKAIPLVVWTVTGDQYREICVLFGVCQFVSKDDGPAALLAALRSILPDEDTAASA